MGLLEFNKKESMEMLEEVVKAVCTLLGAFFASDLLLGGADIDGLRLLVVTILIESIVVAISLKWGLCSDCERELVMMDKFKALVQIIYIISIIVIWISIMNYDVAIWKIILSNAWIAVYPMWSVISGTVEMFK